MVFPKVKSYSLTFCRIPPRLMSTIDCLVGIGGAMGLFTGMSVLSAVLALLEVLPSTEEEEKEKKKKRQRRKKTNKGDK